MFSNSKTFNALVHRYAAAPPQAGDTAAALEAIRLELAQVREAIDGQEEAAPRDQLLDVEDVARLLNVSIRTVETLIAEGSLVPLRIRNRRRFTRDGVMAYLRSTTKRQ